MRTYPAYLNGLLAIVLVMSACGGEGGDGEGEAEAEAEAEAEGEGGAEKPVDGGMPFEAINEARFESLVHPILVANCMGASCHSEGNGLPFTVFPGDVGASYENAVGFVNLTIPAASELLTVAVTNGFLDGPGDPRYDTILAWIEGNPAPGE